MKFIKTIPIFSLISIFICSPCYVSQESIEDIYEQTLKEFKKPAGHNNTKELHANTEKLRNFTLFLHRAQPEDTTGENLHNAIVAQNPNAVKNLLIQGAHRNDKNGSRVTAYELAYEIDTIHPSDQSRCIVELLTDPTVDATNNNLANSNINNCCNIQ